PLAPMDLVVARRNRQRRPASCYDIRSRPEGEDERDVACLIKPRERAACPQLRCVPPDLRGDGARHASRDSLPPSKPYRPHIYKVWPRRARVDVHVQYKPFCRLRLYNSATATDGF